LISPSRDEAVRFYEGSKNQLKAAADRIPANIEIWADTSNRAIRVIRASQSPPSQPEESAPAQPVVNSYAPSVIRPDAGYEAVMDFIAGKRQEGLICTVTSMNTDRCLQVNDLQVIERGGGWTVEDWVGLNFLHLWRDSFKPGNRNYYGELIQTLLRREPFDFLYRIRRPSGAMGEYLSRYFLVERFGGVPVRIAVSSPADVRIVEDAPNGSEVVT
jgi:hypothetical protein